MVESLRPYISDLLATWPADAGPVRELSGAFLFADVSGFTSLSEQLGERGREGAELLSRTISQVLAAFIDAARGRGGDILAFGGDAILVHFGGQDAVLDAVSAGVQMQQSLAHPVEVAGIGPVPLGVSIGVHAGTAAALRVPVGEQVEAVVVGPTITRTLRAEGAATAGQVLATHTAAQLLPVAWHRTRLAQGVLVGSASMQTAPANPPAQEGPWPPAVVPPGELISPGVARIAGTVEADGQHRRVAVGFVRLGRMDEVVAEEGLDVALERVSEVTGVLAEECARAGVQILTVDAYPDALKLLLSAGAPVATHANEEALLEAMHGALRRLPGLNVHMGAHRGLAFAGDLGGPTRRGYTLLGDTVNLAARLMQRADPGELLVTDDIVSRTEMGRSPLPPFRVKGREEPVNAHRIEAGEGQRASVDLALVGRQAEMRRLDELADRAHGGTFVGVDLVGAAGLGKSRLAQEVVNRHPELEPFVGRATAYSSSTPFGLARRLLRVLLGIPRQLPSDEAGTWLTQMVETVAPDLFGELPLIATALDASVDVSSPDLPSDPAVVQRRTAHAVAQLLMAYRTEPMLVIVDDAQWLDDASSQILRRLAMDATASPWMVIAAHRQQSTHVFTGVEGATRIDLEPLGPAEAELLVRTAAGERKLFDEDVTEVVERARGNCLFLVEYARHGDADVPDDVETLIARRLDHLEPVTRRLLGIAAVVGTTIDLDIASRAAERVDGARPDAEQWHAMPDFLVPLRGGVLAWRDPVFRDATYAALPFERRRQLHQAVFQIIEASPSDGSLARSVALATHADKGAMAVEAWELLRKTGELAAREGSPVDAFSLLSRAVHWADELGQAVDQQTRMETLESLGDAAEMAGRQDAAANAFTRAVTLTQDLSAVVRLLASVGRVQMNMGNLDEATSALVRAEALLGDQHEGREEEWARVLLTDASIRYRTGDFDDAFDKIKKAVAIDSVLVPPSVRARAFLVGDAIVADGGGADWMVGRSLSIYDILGDDFGVGASHNNIANVAYREGDWERSLHHWTQSVRAHERAGSVAQAMMTRVNIAEIGSDQGSWESSLSVFVRARESWVAGGFNLGIAFAASLTGRALARLGRFGDALRELDLAATELARVGASDHSTAARMWEVEALWLAGESFEAKKRLGDLQDVVRGTDKAPMALLLSAALSRHEAAAAADAQLVEAGRAAAQAKRWFEYLMAHVLRAQTRGVDPSKDIDVRALGMRLGVWQVATDTGVVRLGLPPSAPT